MENMNILQDATNFSKKNCLGRWSKAQHERFLESLKLFGKNWKKIQEYIGTRTGAQIRSHSQKFFSRLQKQMKKGSEHSENNGIHFEQSHKENYKNQVQQNKIDAIQVHKKQSQTQRPLFHITQQPLTDLPKPTKSAHIESFFEQFFSLNSEQNITDMNVFNFVDIRGHNPKITGFRKISSFKQIETTLDAKQKQQQI